jgi:hypothetical protein
MPGPGTARGDHAASPPVRASEFVMSTLRHTAVSAGAYRWKRTSVTDGSEHGTSGYDGHMGILIAVLVVLAIIALVLYIVRRTRV